MINEKTAAIIATAFHSFKFTFKNLLLFFMLYDNLNQILITNF